MFSRIAIAAMTALLFAVPAPGAAAQSDPGAATGAVRETLANGMHVIVLPNKLAPVATTVVFYKVGFDDDTQPGIAHATEHMLFRGTQDVSAGQFADIAARAGAEYNALTSNEFTMYYFKLPAAYAGVALRLEADRMHHAAISQAAWQTERPAIQQEIRAQQSLPGFAIGQKLKEAFFKGTPFATAGGGTIASFASMRAADIRAFYHKWYQPSNATVIVAGDVDPVKILAQIHALFGSQANTASPAHAPIDVPVLTTATIQDSMDFPVGFGALAYRLPGKNDPDYAASQVLTTALKNGARRLRRRGRARKGACGFQRRECVSGSGRVVRRCDPHPRSDTASGAGAGERRSRDVPFGRRAGRSHRGGKDVVAEPASIPASVDFGSRL